MKQFLFMVVLLVAGSLGSLYHPFWGVLLYYTFATLRPQYLWDWSLPQGVRWSLFAAGAVLLGCVLNASKLMERRRVSRVMAKRFKKRTCMDSEDFSSNVALIFIRMQSVPANTEAARASPAKYAISPKHSPLLIMAIFFLLFLTMALPLKII